MNIFGFEIRRSGKSSSSPPYTTDTGGGILSFSPYMSVGELLSNTTVAACVSIISDAIAMLTCNVYRRDGRSRIPAPDTDLYSILRRCPNPDDRIPFVFFQQILLHLLLRGNAFIYVERQAGYNPRITGLYVLDPEYVEIKRDADTGEIYYLYHCNGFTYKYSTDTILHIPAYRYNRLRGLSPLEYATHAPRLGLRLDEYTDNFFSNGINSKLMVTVPKDQAHWTENDSKELSDRLVKAYGGPKSVHKPFILTKGLTAEPVNIAGNNDSQLVENRTFSEKEIAKIYRVPLYMLGKDDAKFTNTEQMNVYFLQNTLTPWLIRIQQSFDMLLPVYNNDCYIEFDTTTLMRADIKSRMQVYVQGIMNGIYAPNDVLEKENMKLLPDDVGNYPFIPVNMMQLTKANLQAYMAQQKASLQNKTDNGGKNDAGQKQ